MQPLSLSLSLSLSLHINLTKLQKNIRNRSYKSRIAGSTPQNLKLNLLPGLKDRLFKTTAVRWIHSVLQGFYSGQKKEKETCDSFFACYLYLDLSLPGQGK